MYCPKCGKEVKESARFCGYCGNKLPAMKDEVERIGERENGETEKMVIYPGEYYDTSSEIEGITQIISNDLDLIFKQAKKILTETYGAEKLKIKPKKYCIEIQKSAFFGLKFNLPLGHLTSSKKYV